MPRGEGIWIRRLLITIQFLFSLAVFAQQQDDIAILAGLSLDDLMAVKVIVGGRGEARTSLNSLVPVQVVQGQELRQTGAVTTGEALSLCLPSFNYYRTSVTDGTDHLAPGTLKGMAPDQLLVLVNGRRWHQAALLHMNATIGRGNTSYDFDAIPLTAIERVEVLPDGASAQYGSDAVAGIINIVLKSMMQTQVESSLGQTKAGDGTQRVYAAGLGVKSHERLKTVIVAEYKNRGQVNRAGSYPQQHYFDGDPRNGDEAVLSKIYYRYGDAASKDFNFLLNSSYQIDEETRFYALGLLTYRQGEGAGFFRRAQDDRTVRGIYPDGFLPLIAPDLQDQSLVLGMKHEPENGWSREWVVSLARNRFDFYVDNSLNTSYGLQSPHHFYCGTQQYGQSMFSLDLFRSLDNVLPYPLDVGLGAEYRREQYELLAGEPASYANGGVPILDGPNEGAVAPVGAQVYPGYTPEDATKGIRTNVAGYIDLESRLAEKLRAGVAGRIEHYSDFGFTANGKLSLSYQPGSHLTLRSSISSGFRAPSLAQSYFTSTSSVYTLGNFYNVGTYGVNHPLAQSLGAEALKPELSRHASLGLTYNHSSNLSVQISGYHIGLKDKVLITEDFVQDEGSFGSEIPMILEGYGVAGARFFANAADLKAYGFEAAAKAELMLSQSASLLLSAAHHYRHCELDGPVKTPSILAEYETAIISSNDITRNTDGQPEHVTYLQAVLSLGRNQLAAKIMRYGDFYGDINDGGERNHFDGKALLNLWARVSVNAWLTLSAAANNVFDTYPDKRSGTGLLPSVLPYPMYSPFGFSGAFYRIQATVEL